MEKPAELLPSPQKKNWAGRGLTVFRLAKENPRLELNASQPEIQHWVLSRIRISPNGWIISTVCSPDVWLSCIMRISRQKAMSTI